MEIAADGELEYNGTVQQDDGARWDPYSDAWNRYDLIAIDGEFYVPETDGDGETTEALEHIAVPSEQTSSEVREAVDAGSVTVVDQRVPEFERADPIEHEGEVYYVAGHSASSGPSEDVRLGRIFLFLTGGTLVAIAWRKRGAASSGGNRAEQN